MSSSAKPSLINPDFSGLWSVARLGHEKKWYSKFTGTLVHLTLVYSWIGGYVMPLFILYLFTIHYYTTGLILASLITLPYFFTIPPQPWVCRFYMQEGSAYFDGGTTMAFEKEPTVRKPTQPILNAVHPHGIYCLGYLLCCGVRFRAIEDVKEKKTLTQFIGKIHEIEHLKQRTPAAGFASNMLIYVPLFNFFFTKLTGCLMDADNENMKSYMKSQQSFGLLPGGFNEASAFEHGVNVIYIKSRKGFIKYCLQYGYELWPGYMFGECNTFMNLFVTSENTWAHSLKTWLNNNKVPCLFPVGPYWWNLLLPSAKTGIHAIFAGNTRCETIAEPTQAQIDECHEWYMNEINALFERNKWRFGYADDVKLKIL